VRPEPDIGSGRTRVTGRFGDDRGVR